MSAFNQPIIETSWDNGKTWAENGICCGPGMLMRVVAPDGKVLWKGRGILVIKECGGCNGTGRREYHEFEEVHESPVTLPPSGQAGSK